ncbi:MAG TPA: SRPBCC family protein [Gemmata sp.]|nr:SRPBCC family protein [Gemmata sp.]
MTTPSSVSIRVTRRFTASAETVFDAWIDPQIAGRFLFAAPTGQMVKAEIDARVGGKFNFTDRREGDDVEHVGEYLEIDRPRRLVFKFVVPKYSQIWTRVAVEIVPLASDCELALTHEGVLPEYESRSVEGWTMILGKLAGVVE